MKAHIGVDADSGLVHSVEGTAANVNDVTQAHKLLHGEEADAFADAGYQDAHKRPEAKGGVNWHVAMRPGKRKALDLNDPAQAITDKIARIKASIRAKVDALHAVLCSAGHNIRLLLSLLRLFVAHLRAIVQAWLGRSASDCRCQIALATA
jgi:IS5 family transposase